jgi:hypothetical protein
MLDAELNDFGAQLPCSAVMRPTVMGRRKRRGPALPGLKKSVPFFVSILGLVRMTIDHRLDVVGGPRFKLGQNSGASDHLVVDDRALAGRSRSR